jgi:hypothetical protein
MRSGVWIRSQTTDRVSSDRKEISKSQLTTTIQHSYQNSSFIQLPPTLLYIQVRIPEWVELRY